MIRRHKRPTVLGLYRLARGADGPRLACARRAAHQACVAVAAVIGEAARRAGPTAHVAAPSRADPRYAQRERRRSRRPRRRRGSCRRSRPIRLHNRCRPCRPLPLRAAHTPQAEPAAAAAHARALRLAVAGVPILARAGQNDRPRAALIDQSPQLTASTPACTPRRRRRQAFGHAYTGAAAKYVARSALSGSP
jgi:hypothetical protein